MALINMRDKEIQVKIVYYGPAMGGKTTNLQYIYDKYQSRIKTEMVSIKTHGDRTLFFDFLPFDMGKIHDFNMRIQLYTVPGQIKYNSTRRLVLQGVDGMVFVADSQAEQRYKNVESLNNLKENLNVYNKDIFNVPIVMQYNKRDLAHDSTPLLSIGDLENDLNLHIKAPTFAASGITGMNIIPTLRRITIDTIAFIEKELQ